MTFKCKFDGLLLPLFGEGEKDLPNVFRLILYLMGLGWTFLGVAVISDVFMNGIEKVTSAKRRVKSKSTGRTITVYVWNATVANLTLMALGSSAPEILLSLIEITSDNFFLGPLGAGTIVGSAAFNLLCISAVCVCAIPDGEIRKIKDVPVYVVTSSFSVFAYLWLMFILLFSSPDVCEIWEAVVTLLFCPIMVVLAYLADRGYFSKKDASGYTEQSEQHETIPEDVTAEELAAIEQEIRNQHGSALTSEQVIKIMQIQYFHKKSRAYYRHAAMEAKLHGKKIDTTCRGPAESAISEAIATSDEVQQDKMKKMVKIGFAAEKYAFSEGVGKAKISLRRDGPDECKATVNWTTKEGTAKQGSDYEHVEAATVTFEKGEVEKDIFIVIKDDTSFENDEEFYVILSEPVAEGGKAMLTEQHETATIVIIDDDMPGELRFKTEEVETVEGAAQTVVNVMVERFNGATGKISCNYHTDSMGAVAGIDFEEAKGKVEFDTNVQSQVIPVTINARGRINASAFNLVLEEPEGTKFDAKTDGGDEKCICHVTIKAKTGETRQNLLLSMRERVVSANAIQGGRNWSQQFRDALFDVGGGDDDEDDDGSDPQVKEGPSKVDLFMHIISVPWKLLFAFVPPVDYCGGWACFCGALCMIAVVTAIVGDMANLVGCCLDILPETAAITFVALGTSLPDTFASKTAAQMDPYADASIGNITGSNSVNVFLGVGIAWCLAAFKWETGEQTEEWTTRLNALTSSQQENVRAVASLGGNAVFITPGGTLWFNLLVFSFNAFFAIQHLLARRKRWGGELGGPRKGFMGQYFSAAFLVGQWFIYVIASIIFARVGDPMTYGMIASAGAVTTVNTTVAHINTTR